MSPYEKVFCPEQNSLGKFVSWWWQAIRTGPKYSSISGESWDMIVFVFLIVSMSRISWVLFCFTYMEDDDAGDELAKTHTSRLWVSCNLLCGLVLCGCKIRALSFTQNDLGNWSPGLQWPLCGSQAHSEKLLECRLLFSASGGQEFTIYGAVVLVRLSWFLIMFVCWNMGKNPYILEVTFKEPSRHQMLTMCHRQVVVSCLCCVFFRNSVTPFPVFTCVNYGTGSGVYSCPCC